MISSYSVGRKTIVLLLLLFFWTFLLSIPYFIVEYFNIAFFDNSKFMSIYLSVVGLLANFLVIRYAIRQIRKQDHFNLKKDLKNIPVALLPLAIIGAFALVFLVDPLDQFIPMPEVYEQYFAGLFQMKGFSFLIIVLLVPLLKEILLRGIILKGLLKSYSPLKAILLSSLISGIIHVNLIQLITAFILGLFLGYLYWQTKSLSICIILHVIQNLIPYLAMNFLDTGFSIESAIPNNTVYLSLYLFAAIILAFCILFVHRRSQVQIS